MKEITKKYKNFLFFLKKKIDVDEIKYSKQSLNDLFNYFGTDKGSSVINPYSDESMEKHGHGFAKYYEKKLKKFKNCHFNMLEIGTWEGASTAAFVNFFPNSKIIGIDKNFKFKFKSKRIDFFNCDVTNIKDLYKFSSRFSNNFFSIIIDDASHFLTHMILSLKFFFKYLDNGGYFIIEDFNAHSYFQDLNDSDDSEIPMKEILSNIKKKKKFKSKILSSKDQEYLFENISGIHLYKGKTKISDIAFIKKSG